MQTTARMTTTNINRTVAAGTTTQLTFFPGHAEPYASSQLAGVGSEIIFSQMEGVSYHHKLKLSVNSGSTVVGPIAMYDQVSASYLGPTCGILNSGMGVGTVASSPSTATPLGYDVLLPYTAGTANAVSSSSHIRWQLVSMGIRVWNQTPELARGGNVASVQFVNGSGVSQANGSPATSQAELEINPSFRVHGPTECSEGVEVVWMPRLEDLAYWHAINPPNGSTQANNVQSTFNRAAMCIFLNNPTANEQNYAYQVVYHWMLAGTTIQSIANAAVNEPILRSPVEQTVTHLQTTASTASVAPIVAAAATTNAESNESMLSRLKNSAYEASLNMAHAVGKGFAEHVEEQVHRVLAPARGQSPGPRAPTGKMIKWIP